MPYYLRYGVILGRSPFDSIERTFYIAIYMPGDSYISAAKNRCPVCAELTAKVCQERWLGLERAGFLSSIYRYR